jgi:hypothetical protein
MARQEFPVAPEQIPEEARVYLEALQKHQKHPFVAGHFTQMTWFTWFVADRGKVEFYALEFRVGLNAALIWNDGEGNWGAGPWLPLPHADADVTSPPTQLSLRYFEGRKAHGSLLGAIKQLEAAKPA